MVFWHYILPIVFFTAIILQFIYILGFFTRLNNHQDYEPEQNTVKKPSVSIVVAAWNELYNLTELIPILELQDYPNFEIIIADDRSTDGTYDFLLTNEGNYKKVSFVRIENLPDHFTAKKYAVTMGIKKAKNEVILLTDADCRPTSDQWITNMVTQMVEGKNIVLGFSPYKYFSGRLNAFIRYETFQTAVQYFSFALANLPYMGIGRNLMYRRDLFWSVNGFASHYGLLGGDDDLFVNQTSTNSNVAICINPNAHVVSLPKTTFKEWIIQKRRHLSVGKRYKMRDKILLGLLSFSHIICWFWFLPIFFIKPSWFEAPEWSRIPNNLLEDNNLQDFYLYNDWMRLITFVFFTWFFTRWLVLAQANKKLNNTINSWKIPLYDLLYAVYYLIFGIVTIFSNPKKIKWR